MTAPYQTRTLFGHTEAIAAMQKAASGERMHHAWLLCGPQGIGKSTLAYHFANHLLSQGRQPIGALQEGEKNYQLISARAHPDLRVIARPVDETGAEKAEIPVETVRSINGFFRLTSAGQNWRIALITDAEALNRHGQNALLKILEEPPARSLIVMTTTAVGLMLPTIRSRCRVLMLQPLDDKIMRTGLLRMNTDLDAPMLEQLTALSQGSLGHAHMLLENNGLELFNEFQGLLTKNEHDPSPAIQAFADQFVRKADNLRFALFMHFLLDWLGDLIRYMAKTQPQAVSARQQVLAGYASRRNLAGWLEVWDKTRELLSASEGLHLDRKLTVINTLSAVMR